MDKKMITLNLRNGKTMEIPCNYQDFILDYSGTPEGSGWDKEDVIYILKCVKENRLDELELDASLMNSIGCFFNDGICVKPDIEKAVYWYEQAIKEDDDLARSNLADILRKCSQGYPKDLKRAFELYKACGLPYAHYRCGEFYEKGWGTEIDLDKAKAYYQQAYKEGHGLAIKKLKEWNFME